RLLDRLLGLLGPDGGAALLVAEGLADLLAFLVEDEDRRVTLDLVLLAELLVLLLDLVGLVLRLREVHLQEDDVLRRPVLELLRVEDFLVEELAPVAPIAAGEVGEDRLLLLLRRLDRGGPRLEPRRALGLLRGLLLVRRLRSARLRVVGRHS